MCYSHPIHSLLILPAPPPAKVYLTSECFSSFSYRGFKRNSCVTTHNPGRFGPSPLPAHNPGRFGLRGLGDNSYCYHLIHLSLIPPHPPAKGTSRVTVFVHFLTEGLREARVSDSRRSFVKTYLCLLPTKSLELEDQTTYLVLLNIVVCSYMLQDLVWELGIICMIPSQFIGHQSHPDPPCKEVPYK